MALPMNRRSNLPLLTIGLMMTLALQAMAIQEDSIELNTYFKMDRNSQTGRLFVEVTPVDGWNVYSTTQQKGVGPMATKFSFLESDDYSITGNFSPNEDPYIKFDDGFEALVEEHRGPVTWSAPINIAEGVSPQDLEIDFKAKGQSCDMKSGVCTLFNEMLTAEYAGEIEPLELSTTYEPKRGHVVWSGQLSTNTTAPGESVQVTLNAKPTEDYKIYGFEAESQATVAQPTRIAFSKSNGWSVSDVSASPAPSTKQVDGELQKYYRDEVNWTLSLKVPDNTPAGTYRFEGYVAFQNCTDKMCDPPGAAKFVFDLVVGDSAEAKPEKIGFMKAGRYASVAKLADRKLNEKQLLEK